MLVKPRALWYVIIGPLSGPLHGRQLAYTLAQPRFWAKISIFGHFGAKIDSVHRVEGRENASQTHNIISRPHLHIIRSFLDPPGTFGFLPPGLIMVLYSLG